MLFIRDKETVDPRVRRTRQDLQDALLTLLARQDFHSLTVGDIAKQARINRATFYAHFEDKFALLNWTIGEGLQKRLDERISPDATLSPEHLRQLALTTFEFMSDFPRRQCATVGTYRAPVEMWVQAHLKTVLAGWIERIVGDHAYEFPVSVEMLATTISWSVFGAAYQWAGQTPRPPAEGVVDQLLLTLQFSSATPTGEDAPIC